ncbi:Photosystem I reaction center subunit IX [Leptolyngbya sp. FACHB-36]|nr:Photosystem I reaction center subunit IX [Leptolyngbya sp. FACHB-36]MBD2022320.1 Photosystem I reaction center subunit IX [Leptolyngbya sp. FACHB-36]
MSSNFLKYLSLSPVLAVLFVSAALSAFIIINWFYPNLLALGQ